MAEPDVSIVRSSPRCMGGACSVGKNGSGLLVKVTDAAAAPAAAAGKINLTSAQTAHGLGAPKIALLYEVWCYLFLAF